jgi:type IX secretion system PorP/SprF family membrane protein
VKKILFLLIATVITQSVFAQGIHFSQYYNAPLLLNPANTGLLQGTDWRIGINYRNQWSTLPVPFNTYDVAIDGTIGKSHWETKNFGAGVVIYRDVAGNGDLALTKTQVNMAYNTNLGENANISLGLGLASVQRSVDINKLTFDSQWDEFTFDSNLPNNETSNKQKTSYADVAAGVNFSFFDEDNYYVKIGVSAMHINKPIESFYGESNKIGIRPQVNVDAVFRIKENAFINPSVYYTSQKKASQLVLGSLFNLNVTPGANEESNNILAGIFYRTGDALIAVAGYKWKNYRLMINYDHTISTLNKANNGLGAFEFSLVLQGFYRKGIDRKVMLGCPRF